MIGTGTCCCAPPSCGQICITVNTTCFSGGLPGALVTILDGAATVGTATTNASGVACVPIPSAKTYSYTVTKPGWVTVTGSIAATCTTNNRTVSMLTDSTHVGCGARSDTDYTAPPTLYVTDCNGTTTLTRNAACTWAGSKVVAVTGYPEASPFFGQACIGTPVTFDWTIFYSAQCSGTGSITVGKTAVVCFDGTDFHPCQQDHGNNRSAFGFTGSIGAGPIATTTTPAAPIDPSATFLGPLTCAPSVAE